jgi:hypothetical protein
MSGMSEQIESQNNQESYDWDALLTNEDFEKQAYAIARENEKKELDELLSLKNDLGNRMTELSATEDVKRMNETNKKLNEKRNSIAKWGETQPDVVKYLQLQKDYGKNGTKCNALNKKSMDLMGQNVIKLRGGKRKKNDRKNK